MVYIHIFASSLLPLNLIFTKVSLWRVGFFLLSQRSFVLNIYVTFDCRNIILYVPTARLKVFKVLEMTGGFYRFYTFFPFCNKHMVNYFCMYTHAIPVAVWDICYHYDIIIHRYF